MNEKLGMTDEEIVQRLSGCRLDDDTRCEMVREWCADKSVLDFGCGFGGFLKNISQYADKIAGVELGRMRGHILRNWDILLNRA